MRLKRLLQACLFVSLDSGREEPINTILSQVLIKAIIIDSCCKLFRWQDLDSFVRRMGQAAICAD